MLSFKRLMYVILIVAVVSGVFMLYNVNEERMKNIQIQNHPAEEREFTEIRQVESGEKPGVWILGDPEDRLYGEIYANVRRLCEDLHFTVFLESRLDPDRVGSGDLVVFCDGSIGRYADLVELGSFIAGGGRVILAAGLAEGNEDSYLWPVLGIREKSTRENYNQLLFEKPLLPVQPERAVYDGYSISSWLYVSDSADVYIRDAEKGVPILYTYAYQEGGVCLINGTYLSDVRCAGLFTGAAAALKEDLLYPVLGVKTVFLDNFPMITFLNDKLCMQLYGCSTESFVRDVVWPSFQGMSLRTVTPYTSSILAIASSETSFPIINDALFTTIGKSALQFDGELTYAANCMEDGALYFNQDFIDQFSAVFTNYIIRSLAMQTDNFTPEMLSAPGADLRFVRGMLDSPVTRFSWTEDCAVFPAATAGNSIEGGNLFVLCSVLGAYGMISHVFDVNALIARDEAAASWDLDKKQLGIFESQVLDRASWLEGKTLSQTGGDVRSYQNLDYGWTREGSRVELNCSGMAKGQAFFYHTGGRIRSAEGLSYQEAGNGYYLLRVQENYGAITVEEG